MFYANSDHIGVNQYSMLKEDSHIWRKIYEIPHTFIFFLKMVLISAQTIVNKSPKCDTILFLDGTTKTVQVQEVKKVKSSIFYVVKNAQFQENLN